MADPQLVTYVGHGSMRWVLAVMNGRVIYSRGGDRHYECQVRTFNRWRKREHAEPARPHSGLGSEHE